MRPKAGIESSEFASLYQGIFWRMPFPEGDQNTRIVVGEDHDARVLSVAART
jgi:hypothetical protein